ncbi:MAG: helix-turn-helix transcriptional regulator [Lachnospiraceae bacterium]|nr:helix-turn-helix domain-containing protein [Lachnospiraceae bacterium]MDD7379093.1 helix-turn-helix transcriptional regulator [Lachnospiraceae bacterium]MDY4617193.1 helix-turn-helix transcriptional regulator [Lachnospiraceae bacterium]
MENIKLAKNISFLRKQRGITQDVLADFLGVTKASVSKWETGVSHN